MCKISSSGSQVGHTQWAFLDFQPSSCRSWDFILVENYFMRFFFHNMHFVWTCWRLLKSLFGQETSHIIYCKPICWVRRLYQSGFFISLCLRRSELDGLWLVLSISSANKSPSSSNLNISSPLIYNPQHCKMVSLLPNAQARSRKMSGIKIKGPQGMFHETSLCASH